MAITFTVEDLREPYRVERVLRQFQTAIQNAVKTTEDLSLIVKSPAVQRDINASTGLSGGGGGIPGASVPSSLNNVVYQTSSLVDHAIVLGNGDAKVKPGTLGSTTTVLHGNASGDPSYGLVVLTSDVSGTLPVANGGTGITYDRIADTVALTAQTADIGSTNFANSGTGTTFRVSYYLETTTADGAAGTVTVTFAFTDAAGATTVVSTAVNLTAADRQSGVFFVQRASGNVAYSTSHTGIYGTSQYALYACFERLS